MSLNNAQYCPYLRMVCKDFIDPLRNHPPRSQRVLLDYELFYVTKGRGRSIIGGQSHDLQPHRLYLIRPGVAHYHEIESYFEYYYVHLDIFYFQQREQSFIVPWSHELSEKERRFMQPDMGQQIELPFSVSCPLPSQTQSHFEQLLSVYHQASTAWRLQSQGYLLQLLQPFLVGDQESSDDASLQKRLQRSIVFMRNNVHQHLSLDCMADAAHLSRYYFLRQFKEQYQMTPAQYHKQLRMEAAAYRLQNSSDSVQVIADELGFKTPFHFSRCFKQQYALSPRAFRSV